MPTRRGKAAPRPNVEQAFGAALRGIRAERSVSQEMLAHDADFHRNHIGLLERGERGPSLKAVFRIADALGVRATDLVREVEDLVAPPHDRT